MMLYYHLLRFALLLAQFQAALFCGGFLTADNTVQTLTSPEYPRNYPSNTKCVWRIRTVSTQVIMHLMHYYMEENNGCTYDVLNIYLGSISYSKCGNATRSSYFLSQSNIVFIDFKSDGSHQYMGFKLAYANANAIPAETCYGTIQRLTAQNESKTLEEHGSITAAKDINCEWNIVAERGFIEIDVLGYEIDATTLCSAGSLEIYNSRDDRFPVASLCGSTTNANLSFWTESSEAYVKLHYDFTITHRSFRLQYRIVESPRKNPDCLGRMTELQASDSDQILKSPSYPEDYDNFITCVWRIESPLDLVQVTLEDYGFDFYSNDTLVITDIFNSTSSSIATLRGSSKIRRVFWSSSNVTYIHFYTDGSGTDRGFKLTYKAVDQSAKDNLGEPSNLVVHLLTSLCTIEFVVIVAIGVTGLFYWKRRSQVQGTQKRDRHMQELEAKVTTGKIMREQSNIYETACSDDYVNACKR